MNNRIYILGFICGLAVVAIICLAKQLISKHKQKQQPKQKQNGEFDERQEAIRGTGFKYTYLTAMLVLLLGGCIDSLAGGPHCSTLLFALIDFWISISVFTTYCVVKDAYFTLRSQRKTLICVFLVVGLINIGIGTIYAVGEGLIADGMLSSCAINLITGVCCVYLGLMMIARSIYERRQELEE